MKALKAAILLICVSGNAVSDRINYSEVWDSKTAGNLFVVRHHHDWSDATKDARYEMISTHMDPFRPDNNYAYLQCIDRNNSQLLFTLPTPALTYVWISPDSKYIVGLSKIQLWNPYQMIVVDSSGTLLFKEHITPDGACLALPEYHTLLTQFPHLAGLLSQRSIRYRDSVFVDCYFMGSSQVLGDSVWQRLYAHTCNSPYSSNFSESVTNWVWWYNEQDPDIHCIEFEGKLIAVSLLDNKGDRIVIPFSRVIE